MSTLRALVLKSFKKLHRTRKKVFAGDEHALNAARLKINEEYNKNKHIKDERAISEMIKFGEQVEKELKTQVIQAREIKPGVFAAKITEDTVKLDNILFNEKAMPDGETSQRGATPCCQDQSQKK